MATFPVIAAVDGSDHSLRGLEWALVAARLRGAEVLVVHVWPWPPNIHGAPEPLPEPPPTGQDPVLDWVREQLEGRAGLPEVRYTTVSGAPAATLPEMGAQGQLLVLGSRGRGGFASLLLGSNGRACAAHAACPVVVVPHRERGHGAVAEPYGRVVLGLEPGETIDAVVDFAFQEAGQRDSLLQVITTFPVPFSTLTLLGSYPETTDPEGPEIAREVAQAQRDRLRIFMEDRYPQVRVEFVVAPGDAAGRLVAASESSDLIVVGRHRHRLPRANRAVGSVTNAALVHARCPIAVVPGPER
ncbi:universal stress protein [Streptomyces gobiensis]|uniref:universal stress protein n=1 Tax=Streptomyces gobiensis TaxID=2875706 RepID=UPI001E4A498F|nr:universal stress protein [Streptomyces gobiensis]UGY94449.1 universal stress protein [Streptomyces gobiensis]